MEKPRAGLASTLGNVIWLIVAGWWLALGHIVTGIALCVTIIGIPFGIANFKLVPGVAVARSATRSSSGPDRRAAVGLDRRDGSTALAHRCCSRARWMER